MSAAYANLPGIILKIQDSSSPNGYRRQHFPATLTRHTKGGHVGITVDYSAAFAAANEAIENSEYNPESIWYRRGDGLCYELSLLELGGKAPVRWYPRADCGSEVWLAAESK